MKGKDLIFISKIRQNAIEIIDLRYRKMVYLDDHDFEIICDFSKKSKIVSNGTFFYIVKIK